MRVCAIGTLFPKESTFFMKRETDYVLVFKLSRLGRNAADVLASFQRMQDYGVNLICVEDGIDSSKDAGKLMRRPTVLSMSISLPEY